MGTFNIEMLYRYNTNRQKNIIFSLFVVTVIVMISIVDSNEGTNPCNKAGISFRHQMDSVIVKTHGSAFIPCEFAYNPPNGNSSKQSTQRPVPFWRTHYGSGDIQPPSQTLFYGNLPLNHKYNRTGLIILDIDSRFHNATYACCFELFSTTPEICEANNTKIIVTTGGSGAIGADVGGIFGANMVFIIVVLTQVLYLL
jgi:hypothetical protein